MTQPDSITIEKVPCEVCLREIPASEAKTAEALDYVVHFCGIDCYVKWKEQQAREDEGSTGA